MERALVDQTHGSYVANREGCREKRWRVTYDDGATVELLFITWRRGRQLIDFLILVQRRRGADWEDVTRIDCCHGHCHLHPIEDTQQMKELMALETIADVAAAFVVAQGRIESYVVILRDEGRLT